MKSEQRQAIEELIYRSCLALDARDFKSFLELCDAEFRYTITTHSPEIRRDMVWLHHQRKGVETPVTNHPRHVQGHGRVGSRARRLVRSAGEEVRQACGQRIPDVPVRG